jgi:hypothetical protein
VFLWRCLVIVRQGLRARGSAGVSGMLVALVNVNRPCLYFDRYQTEYCRNLRFGPLFSEGFRFASRINKSPFIRLRVTLPVLCLDERILALKCGISPFASSGNSYHSKVDSAGRAREGGSLRERSYTIMRAMIMMMRRIGCRTLLGLDRWETDMRASLG